MKDGALFVGEPNARTWNEGALLGFAADVLTDTDRSRLSIASLDAWLRLPIRLGQIAFVFGERGLPLAFATWAYVSRRTAGRLASGGPPHPEEWNDGDLLWIVDVVAPHGNLRELLGALRRGPGANRENAAARRRRGSGSMRTVSLARSDRTS